MTSETDVLERRFITLENVREVLSISNLQAYALVRSGDLRAIQIGGRGQWRVETVELEAYIERRYKDARSETVAENTARPESE